jgi:hypothetical protein
MTAEQKQALSAALAHGQPLWQLREDLNYVVRAVATDDRVDKAWLAESLGSLMDDLDALR